MKRVLVPLLAACLALALASPAKPKKKSVLPEVFNHARYVFVEAYNGDAFSTRVYPEDRRAIADVQDALDDWNRYTVSMQRKDAEMIFVVRRGGEVKARVPVVLSPGRPQSRNPTSTSPPPGQDPAGSGVGVETDVGSPDDSLFIYAIDPSGGRGALLWSRSLKDGLAEPNLPLFQQIKKAVETDYPK